MIPNIGTIMFPEMLFGSLVISAVTTTVMLTACFLPSKRPNLVGYLCLAAGFIGIITSALLIERFDRITFTPYYYLLYGLYNSLIYISVFVLLHLTARQQKQEKKSSKYLQIGTYFIYIGYLWSVVVLAAGIALIILWEQSKEYLNPNISTGNGENGRKSYGMATQAALFTYYSIWGFIAINLVLAPILYSTFKDVSKRYALILFNLLTIIAMITSTVIPTLMEPGDAFKYAKVAGFIGIFLLDLPNALAIVIWFFVHGGKSDRQQSVPLHGEADTATTSSNANILPSHKNTV